jgi:hypothetical protein
MSIKSTVSHIARLAATAARTLAIAAGQTAVPTLLTPANFLPMAIRSRRHSTP